MAPGGGARAPGAGRRAAGPAALPAGRPGLVGPGLLGLLSRDTLDEATWEEVEETLLAHAKVSDAAVIGVEDEKWGQALKAYVVTKGSVSEAALKKHVKEQLAGYKVPQAIEFIDELPRNAAGKVLKREPGEDD